MIIEKGVCGKTITFTEDVKVITEEMMLPYRDKVEKVTIPDSVTSIGEGAFEDCSRLTSVTIPNSVKAIGAYAFCGCSGLTSVTIPDSVKAIGAYAFCDCFKLTSVIIPNSVKAIGVGVFSNCSSLKKYDNRYFKITDKNMKCRDFQYEMDKWYINEGKVLPCVNGFHSCRRPTDCFNYYYKSINDLRFFEVEIDGNVIEHNDKICSEKIKFVKEYTFKEFIDLANN